MIFIKEKTRRENIFLFLYLFAIGLVVAGVVLAWTNPSGNPPIGGGTLFYSGGSVGIGTASPSEKLDVNGGIKIGNSTGANAGTIRWTGTAFEGYSGTSWGSLGGGGGGVPNGTIVFYNGINCPAGWSAIDEARGRYIVGLNSGASGSDVGVIIGSALTGIGTSMENRVVGPHAHNINDPKHYHSILAGQPAVGGSGLGTGTAEGGRNSYSEYTGITVLSTGTNISTTAGTNAPYIQYLVCKYVGTGGSTAGTTVPGYKYGLTVTYTSSNVVNITATSLEVGGLLINTINVSPSLAVSGANGLDTGSEAANTWYAVYVITNDAGTSVAGLYSTNFTAPTLPGGYTKSRRVGAVRNNVSSNIIEFIQYDNRVYYADYQEALAGGAATSWTDVNLSNYVPPTSRLALINFLFFPNGGSSAFNLRRNGQAGTTGWRFSIQSTSQRDNVVIDVPLDSSRIFEYMMDAADAGIYVRLNGYTDTL